MRWSRCNNHHTARSLKACRSGPQLLLCLEEELVRACLSNDLAFDAQSLRALISSSLGAPRVDSQLTLLTGPMISGAHPQSQLTVAQQQAQHQMMEQARERAKLRSQKPVDRNIPEGVEDCVIGDGVQRYRDLRELERRLDSTMMRKRLDIQDSVNRNVKVGI